MNQSNFPRNDGETTATYITTNGHNLQPPLDTGAHSGGDVEGSVNVQSVKLKNFAEFDSIRWNCQLSIHCLRAALIAIAQVEQTQVAVEYQTLSQIPHPVIQSEFLESLWWHHASSFLAMPTCIYRRFLDS